MTMLQPPSTATKNVAGDLSSADYQYLCDLLKTRSGLALSTDKGYLIESRLLPVARENSLKNISELVSALRANRSGLATQVINAMATHETFFFRDGKPFELFKDFMLPSIAETNKAVKHMRIWCAACSSGQEPYTLSMILKEKREFAGWSIDIVGTDISSAIVERAKSGMFTQFEVQRGLPIQLLVKYFKEVESDWQIDPEIRKSVKFQILNLLDDFRGIGKFDVVMCRNVLIYFDPPTKAKVLENISKQMNPHAFLVLGGSETVLGLSHLFELVEGKRGIYKLANPS